MTDWKVRWIILKDHDPDQVTYEKCAGAVKFIEHAAYAQLHENLVKIHAEWDELLKENAELKTRQMTWQQTEKLWAIEKERDEMSLKLASLGDENAALSKTLESYQKINDDDAHAIYLLTKERDRLLEVVRNAYLWLQSINTTFRIAGINTSIIDGHLADIEAAVPTLKETK